MSRSLMTLAAVLFTASACTPLEVTLGALCLNPNCGEMRFYAVSDDPIDTWVWTVDGAVSNGTVVDVPVPAGPDVMVVDGVFKSGLMTGRAGLNVAVEDLTAGVTHAIVVPTVTCGQPVAISTIGGCVSANNNITTLHGIGVFDAHGGMADFTYPAAGGPVGLAGGSSLQDYAGSAVWFDDPVGNTNPPTWDRLQAYDPQMFPPVAADPDPSNPLGNPFQEHVTLWLNDLPSGPLSVEHRGQSQEEFVVVTDNLDVSCDTSSNQVVVNLP